MEQRMKAPREVKVVAYLAAITMSILSAAGIKAIISEPKVITNHEVVMMPNDSIVSMKSELAALKSQVTTLGIVADARLEIIKSFSGLIKGLGDSINSVEGLYAITEEHLQEEAEKREASNSELLAKLDKLSDSRRADIASMFRANMPIDTITKHDTVYATLPEERRNFWLRLRVLFKGR